MGNLRQIWSSFWGNKISSPDLSVPLSAIPSASERSTSISSIPSYAIGDRIGGLYEIKKILGGQEGHGGICSGMGIVYVTRETVFSRMVVLKTFQDRYLSSSKAREAFRQEGYAWIPLNGHPHIVSAQRVWEFGGRLYLFLEYVEPDSQSRNTLTHYLGANPLGLDQILTWAIQFCYGMEYAIEKNLLCHRDIKPDNIMISMDGNLKITDFGLARIFENVEELSINIPEAQSQNTQGLTIFRIGKGVICGTPGYMAPEILQGKEANIRSDIYAFGVVLAQMITGVRHPNALTKNSRPLPSLVQSPIWSNIKKCLDQDLLNRYSTFEQLRYDLERQLRDNFGKEIHPPKIRDLSTQEVYDQCLAFSYLGLEKEANECFQRIFEILPEGFMDWNNRGVALCAFGRNEEALSCFEQGLKMKPDYPIGWKNMGEVFVRLRRFQEALDCYGQATVLDPEYADAWCDKGMCLGFFGQHNEAIECFGKAIEINPCSDVAWYNKGFSYSEMERHQDSLVCFERALYLNPKNPKAWLNKGNILDDLGHFEDAKFCYEQALTLSPNYLEAWINKGLVLRKLGEMMESLSCFDKVLEVNPQDPRPWYHKGCSFRQPKKINEALYCFNKAKQFGDSRAAEAIRTLKMEAGH